MSKTTNLSPSNLSGTSPASPSNAGLHVVATAVAGFSSPTYRGALNHGSAAELQEGFRILTSGKNYNILELKEMHTFMRRNGLHVSEEELSDVLHVVHQDERSSQLEFAEFMLLMTKEVSVGMMEEMKTAFHYFDKAGTGYITKKQFAEMFVAFGEHSSAEELEELLAAAENHLKPDNPEMIDYNTFVEDLAVRVNKM